MADGSAVRSITVLGDAPGGVATRLAVTVLINGAILQRRTVVGVGEPEQIATAAVELGERTSTGIASSGTLATAAVSLEERTAFGGGPLVAAPVREELTALGVALNGTIANGIAVRKARTASGIALSSGLGVGAVTFQQRTATGVSLNGGQANGVSVLQRRQAVALGIGGSVGTAAVSLQRRISTGVAYPVGISTGAANRQLMMVDSFGEATLAESYRSWVLNVQNEALTEYTNFSFNSYAVFNNKLYAAGPNGLVVLEGADDAGTAIPWTLQTGFHDDKEEHQKRLHEIVMALRHDAPVRVRVWTNESTYYDYTLANYREHLQQVRVKTGKGLKSRYFRIELTGMGGTSFELQTLLAPFMPVDRRIG